MGADCVEIPLSDLVDISNIFSGARSDCADYYFRGYVLYISSSGVGHEG
jgi:hypothetical protein